MEQSKDLFAQAETELASIDAKIAALHKRRTELAEFVARGKRLFGLDRAEPHQPTFSEVGTQFLSAVEKFVETTTRVREDSMKARILAVSREVLTEIPHATTAHLVEQIEARGVAITGKDKNVTVSVILSRSDEFVSDRTRGWSLTKKNPQDVAASAGSSTA